jgi:hypothetical protein
LRLQVTLPEKLRRAGHREAAKQKISFSRFMECLVFDDAAGFTEHLDIQAVMGVPSPRRTFLREAKIQKIADAHYPAKYKEFILAKCKAFIGEANQLQELLVECADYYQHVSSAQSQHAPAKLANDLLLELGVVDACAKLLFRSILEIDIPVPVTNATGTEHQTDDEQ